MIIDRLDNAALYAGLSPRIAAALRYLQSTDCLHLPVGKVPIDGDQMFALVQDNTTKPREQGVWEAHRKYLDVQFVAAGIEEMGYANIHSLEIKQPYDDSKDCAFFTGSGSYLLVPAGYFTIFFPEDGHMPGLAAGGQPAPVRKVVVKVVLA